jgi:hypothetical protein
MLALVFASFALLLALLVDTNTTPDKIPIIATTIKSSIRVKPGFINKYFGLQVILFFFDIYEMSF